MIYDIFINRYFLHVYRCFMNHSMSKYLPVILSYCKFEFTGLVYIQKYTIWCKFKTYNMKQYVA